MNRYLIISVNSLTTPILNRSVSKVSKELPIWIKKNDDSEHYLLEVTEENLLKTNIYDSYIWYSKEDLIAELVKNYTAKEQ